MTDHPGFDIDSMFQLLQRRTYLHDDPNIIPQEQIGRAGSQIPGAGISAMLDQTNFGDGSDGDVVISGDTTLTGTKQYANLTVNAGVVLTTAGYPVYVQGVCTIEGAIACDGGAGGNGGDGTSSPGTGGSAGTNTLTAPQFVGSGSGASGGQSGQATAAGDTATAMTAAVSSWGPTYSRSGGGGGNSNNTSNGGSPSPATNTPIVILRSPYNYLFLGTDATVMFPANGAGGGGGGGGTGGPPYYQGGGGGGGGARGGIVVLAASVLAGSGVIRANGGNGGNGGNGSTGGNSGGGGAGSGGNGGIVALVYHLQSDWTGTTTVTGGTKGTVGAGNGTGGSGQAGSDGSDGTVLSWRL
jgi:hypothetical protein